MKELTGNKSPGLVPLMASCSKGQIGALNAESFCERVLSQSNLVMTDGNTLLSDEEIEMVVILRVNREFMEFMREQQEVTDHLKTKLPGQTHQGSAFVMCSQTEFTNEASFVWFVCLFASITSVTGSFVNGPLL